MIFKRINESIVDDVKDTYNKKQDILKQVRELLVNAGFTESTKLNGTSFNKEVEVQDNNNSSSSIVTVQMYIDVSDLSYSCYISSTDNGGITTSNFSSKGRQDTVIDATKKLIFQLHNI